MESRFDNRDFERIVQQHADQYRMFPSEKVWKGIHNTLHTRNRWYGIGLTLLILTTGVVSWVMLSTSGKNSAVVSSLPPVSAVQLTKQKPVPAIPVTITPRVNNTANSFIISPDKLQEEIYMDDYVAVEKVQPTDELSASNAAVFNQPAVLNELITDNVMEYPVVKASSTPRRVIQQKEISAPVALTKEKDIPVPVIADNQPELPAAEQKQDKPQADYSSLVPYTVESVINSYKYIRKRNKISIEAFITPTVSYRELRENKPFVEYARNAQLNVPNASYAADVNTVVTHKPDIGIQAGFMAGLPVSKRIKLIGGLQFNVSKYDIRAYDHSPEWTTIALSTAAGGANNFSAKSNYRNVSVGGEENWLHNLYFSASAPVGLEVRLAGNRKNYFGFAATAQPTYMLSNDAYLISTDYMNYTEVPSLTRHWNMNAGFELFAGVSTGHLRWRVGPQVRYQTMSSFKKNYPIMEHLFDFGLKMGIMLK